jgi:DNA-binding NarL/FixJ family response regulator
MADGTTTQPRTPDPARVGDERLAAPSGSPSRISVLLVEDHPVFCDGLRALFARDESFELVGQAANGATALRLTHTYHPDVILLDIGLADTNGLDLVNQLRRTWANAKIIVLTGRQDREYLMSAVRLGVHGYLQKDMAGEAIFAALRQVVNGERVIGQPRAVTTVLTEFGQMMRERERERYGLTDQEVEMLRLAAAGLNNKDIGGRQFLSEITVKRKMQDTYRKLEVKSRAQAVAEAIRLGFI